MLTKLLRQCFIRLDDWREGNRRLAYVPEVRRFSELSREQLLAEQWQRMQGIIATACKEVPFYRQRFDEAGLSPAEIKTPADLDKIPLLVRDDLRHHQDDLFNPTCKREDLFETGSGGTTDAPIRLYLDQECLAKRRACTLYFQRWLGYELGDKQAYLWGAEQDLSQLTSFKSRLRARLIGHPLYLLGGYLNDEIMHDYYRRLREFEPKVLQAYPTSLYIFSLFLEREGLQLSIKNLNTVAEFLYPYQRQKIEEVFGTQVFNWYGARELGHVATECPAHRGMHINCYGLYVEVLKNGKAVTDELGEIVVTDLHNRAFPLIRYRIGDLGTVSYRTCTCGSALPLIEEVGGRYADTFKKRDGTFVPGVSFVNRVVKECTAIEKLQIVQKDYEHFQLNLVKGQNFDAAEVERLKQRVSDYLREPLTFDVVFVDKIQPERSGKVMFCKSDIGKTGTSTS